MSIDEKKLIKNVKNSKKSSFQKLFFQFHDQLFRFVVYRVQDADIAKDITQETFLRIFKTLTKIYPVTKSIFAKTNKFLGPTPNLMKKFKQWISWFFRSQERPIQCSERGSRCD